MAVRHRRIISRCFAALLAVMLLAVPLLAFAAEPYVIEAYGPTEMQTAEAFIEIVVRDVAGNGWQSVTVTTSYDGAVYDLTEPLLEYDRVAIRITGNTEIVITVVAPDGAIYTDSRSAYLFPEQEPAPPPESVNDVAAASTAESAPEQSAADILATDDTSGQNVQNSQPDSPLDSEVENSAPEPLDDPGDVPPMNTDGTSTVIDNAVVDGSEREFFTVSTPLGSVFYLVVDRNKEDGNVFFLNAVTERDLIELAEGESWTAEVSTTEPEPSAPDDPAEEPAADDPAEEQEQPEETGGTSPLLLVGAIALVGLGAGWYFKIYRPKQLAAADDDDSEEYNGDEPIPYGDDLYEDDGWGDPEPESADPPEWEDDAPTWDDDDEGGE